MEPVRVYYTKSSLQQAVKQLCQVGDDLGYTLWSLQGNPSHLRLSPKDAAMRISIFFGKIASQNELTPERSIGTAHLVQVADDRIRINFQREDMLGQTLAEEVQPVLGRFCDAFDGFISNRSLKLSDRETGGRTSLLDRLSETGPLSA